MIGGDNAVHVNYSAGDGGTWWHLGGYVKAISAGLDYFPHYDQVFGIGRDNHIYVHDANPDPWGSSWQLVDNTASFAQISATQQNTVYAIDSNGRLHRSLSPWFASGWVDQAIAPVFAGQRFAALSADSQDFWNDEVYVIEASSYRRAYLYQSTGGWITAPVAYFVTDISGADYGWFYFSWFRWANLWNGTSSLCLGGNPIV